jgi:hypothetical protein
MAKTKSKDEVVFQNIVSHLRSIEATAESRITNPSATNLQSSNTTKTALCSTATPVDGDP